MFTLDQVVPWGRSFDEYRRMFALSDADLALNILGCGDGPAGFNAEATRRGDNVISCDPIYQFTTVELRGRIAATYDQILDQTRKNPDEFVWTTITSVEELGRVRMEAMRTFLDDFDAGKAEGRYVEARAARRCRSPTRRSTSRCARTSCFSTRSSLARISTVPPSPSCAASPARCASSRSSRSAGSRRRTSASWPTRLVPPGTTSSSNGFPTNFSAAGTK